MAEATLMDQISTAELLGRIDERTNHTSRAVTAMDVKLDMYGERLSRVEEGVGSFGLVKTVVYGAVGLVLVAFASAVIGLAVYRPAILQQQQQPKSVEIHQESK